MALHAPTTGDLDEHEPALLGELLCQLKQQQLDVVDRGLGHLGEELRFDRLVGHHQDGLDGSSSLCAHQPSYASIAARSAERRSGAAVQRSWISPNELICSMSMRPC